MRDGLTEAGSGGHQSGKRLKRRRTEDLAHQVLLLCGYVRCLVALNGPAVDCLLHRRPWHFILRPPLRCPQIPTSFRPASYQTQAIPHPRSHSRRHAGRRPSRPGEEAGGGSYFRRARGFSCARAWCRRRQTKEDWRHFGAGEEKARLSRTWSGISQRGRLSPFREPDAAPSIPRTVRLLSSSPIRLICHRHFYLRTLTAPTTKRLRPRRPSPHPVAAGQRKPRPTQHSSIA